MLRVRNEPLPLPAATRLPTQSSSGHIRRACGDSSRLQLGLTELPRDLRRAQSGSHQERSSYHCRCLQGADSFLQYEGPHPGSGTIELIGRLQGASCSLSSSGSSSATSGSTSPPDSPNASVARDATYALTFCSMSWMRSGGR